MNGDIRLIEAHILFNELQEKAKKVGLVLEFKDNTFLFRTGFFGRYKADNGKTIDVPELTMRISNYSYDAILSAIDMWKFSCRYQEMIDTHEMVSVK